MNKLLLLICCICFAGMANAQTGSIQGTIIDASTKEPIVGAIVLLDSTKDAQSTDIDGKFTFSNVKEGVHKVSVNFIGYEKKTFGNVKVTANNTSTLNVPLALEGKQINEVTVKDVRKRNTEASIVTDVKEASVIVSGVSGAQIQKSQDRSASDVVKRIPGVTIEDGRFINVRGLSERYNSVWLNDAQAPSSEADKKAFSFDILPSGMIERIMIYKTPAAELPGDFAGGMVKIYTQAIPDKNYVSVNYSSSFRQGSTFKPVYYTQGSKTDMLGFDNGYRAIPNGTPTMVSHNDSNISAISKAFKNTWGIQSRTAIPDQRAGLTFARVKKGEKLTFGSITALNYSFTQSTFDIQYDDYDSVTHSQSLMDTSSTRQVSVGVMENFAFRFGNNTIECKNLFNQIGKEVTTMRGNYFRDANEHFYGEYYQSRSIVLSQLDGKHSFKNNAINYNWNVSYGYSYRNEPDFRRIKLVYNPNDSLYKAPIANVVDPVNGGGRFYTSLYEHNISFNHEYTHKITAGTYKFEVDAGNTVEYKWRGFAARTLGYTIKPNAETFGTLELPLSQIFDTANVGGRNQFRLDEITSPSDSYKAQNLQVATFVQFNLPIGNRVKLLVGARYIYNKQSLQSHVNLDSVSPQIIGNFVLPSANLSVSVAPQMLVRFAYGETVNFPEFREWSPFYFYDFQLRAGNYGSLFPTVYFPKGTVLKTAKIHNADVRYEWYPSHGDLIQVGGFFKYFIDPIQQVITPSGGSDSKAFTFINGDHALCYGGEIDVRKSLSFLANATNRPYFNNFALVFNLTVQESKLTLPNLPSLLPTSRLQGQSPYVVNAGIFYQDDSLGLQASLLYNVFGPRIYAIGNTGYGSIGEMPRNSLDLLISYTVIKRLTLSFGIQDIVNQPSKLVLDIDRSGTFNNKGGLDQTIRQFNYGRYFTLGLKLKI